MHELSIVQNIIEIVASEMERLEAKRVAEVHLEIGKLSGVEYELIEFALKNLSRGSVIESSNILIDKPEGEAMCKQCGNIFTLEDFIGCCDRCSSFDLNIIKGKELRIKSISIE
jgi:hydrogenase nickel incorporation protein HypA/HybF